MNLKEDIKIGYNNSLPFEDFVIRIECKDITKGESLKQQIIQWQKKAEKYDEFCQKVGFEINNWQDDIDRIVQGYQKYEKLEKQLSETKARYDRLRKKIEDRINYYSCGSSSVKDSANRIMIKKELSSLMEKE